MNSESQTIRHFKQEIQVYFNHYSEAIRLQILS